MKYVEFYKLENDGSQRVIATCKLVGNEVTCEGNEALIRTLSEEGIVSYEKEPRRLFPKDGLVFLEQLSFTFKSGYLNASEVKEK